MANAQVKHVLLNNTTTTGHAYVELLEDGRVKAGYYEDTAKVYSSAEEAYARFRGVFDFSQSHSSWNICYVLEDYISLKDEGR